ncbi:MAG: hypothetical protein AAF533_12040 [Acidobacteriota bacterium]
MKSHENRHGRLAPLAVLLGLMLATALPAAANSDLKFCLMDYKRLNSEGDKDGALDALRGCAKDHEGTYMVHKLLGTKLAELAEGGRDELRPEAITQWSKASELSSEKFGALHLRLGNLHLASGQEAEGLAALTKALDYVGFSEKRDVENQLWELYRKFNDDENALKLWKEIGHRYDDDHGSQVAAARLLEASGDSAGAKKAWGKAAELDPNDREAKSAYERLLTSGAAGGGSTEKAAFLNAWMGKLHEADMTQLVNLLDLSEQLMRSNESLRLANEISRRDPGNGRARMFLARVAMDEGNTDTAESYARSALNGQLDSQSRGEAHALLGSIIEKRTYSRYSRAPSKTGSDVINRAVRGYDEALSHFRQAQSAGLDMSRQIRNVRDAKNLLGGQQADLGAAQREADRAACSRLAKDARFAYDQGKALTRTSRGSVQLAYDAGGSGQGGLTVSGGTTVEIKNASYSGGTCWLQVRAPDGTQGWARESKFR